LKGNDQPERVITEFKMAAFELGQDEDGDAITTAIVSTDYCDPRSAASAGKATESQAAATPKAALDALFECIADNPTSPPRDPHVPAGVTGVSLDTWRDRLMKLAIINAKGSHREQFKRIRVTLQNAKIHRHLGEFRVAHHIRSHGVTVTERDAACQASRHIRPL